MNISIELVPRVDEFIKSELELISKKFTKINMVNYPDLMRFSVRSWEACYIAKKYYNKATAHVRAIDFNLKNFAQFKEIIEKNKINEILVITGDYPLDMRKVYPTTCIDFIKKAKKELENVKIFAGVDQYRNSIKKENEYLKMKLDAGADGFFTQPFFDLRLMEIYNELFNDCEVYWGISPVIQEKSAGYWETKNNVIFPKDFKYSEEWNANFAKKAIKFAYETNTNVYLMPIRIELEKYLASIFEN